MRRELSAGGLVVIWAGWVPLEEAPKQLSYDGEREMATKALARGGT